MAQKTLTEDELKVIRAQVDEFKNLKSKLSEKIRSTVNQVISAKMRSDLRDSMRDILLNINSSLNTVFLHYEEIGFLESIKEDVDDVSNLLLNEINDDILQQCLSKINEINFLIQKYEAVKSSFKDLSINALSPVIAEVNTELSNFRRLRNLVDNARTEGIYNNAVIKYRNLEENYRSYFYWGLAIVLCLSVGLLTLKHELVPYLFSTIEFWAVKVSLLLVGITLISYFLKQSAHYQRLADQNYQTQVELQAYPSFMESIPTEEAASVRKELALKYFGREVDGTAHKDMSNLISDQMKSTTEMVKATTEAIKNLKG